MFMTPNRCPQPLRPGILKLQSLDHLHVGQVSIRNCRPSPVYIESSLRQWLIEALVTFARGDDDMRLAVHEAAGLVSPDFANRKRRGVDGSGLGRVVAESEEKVVGRSLVQGVDADVVVGVGGVVDGKDVAEGLRCIRWEFVRHFYYSRREMVSCVYEIYV